MFLPLHLCMESLSKESLMTFGRRIALDIGEKLQIEIEGISIPLESQVVGLEHEVFILIKTPRPYPTIMHKLHPNSYVIVKYMYEEKIFAFQAKIIESITKPFQLLFLEYPKVIQHLDLRDFNRIDCIIPALILVKNESKHGTIVDLSSHGCRVQIPIYPGDSIPFIGINDEVGITAKFPGVENDLQLSGNARNLRKSRHEIFLGIVFHGLSTHTQEKIGQYLADIEDLFKEEPS